MNLGEDAERLGNMRQMVSNRAMEIIRELETTRGYEFVVETDQSRKEWMSERYPNGALISFFGVDISEEVATLTVKRAGNNAE